MRWLGHGVLIVVLTLLTQLGGLAWLVALRFRHRLAVFAVLYVLLVGLAQIAAPAFGRVALPCAGAPLRMQSLFYCGTMRNFVTPEMAEVARAVAAKVAKEIPGSVTLALDGGFPFLNGMPLLPHLSHDDGEKLDFAFFYTSEAGDYLPGKTRSPVGYWAFEGADPDACPPVWITTRWDMDWLQPLWPDRPLELVRTAALIRALLADARTTKVFVEPPLAVKLGFADDKLRFQGCRAARHDDHIHAQL